jgi:hypothetical protein
MDKIKNVKNKFTSAFFSLLLPTAGKALSSVKAPRAF